MPCCTATASGPVPGIGGITQEGAGLFSLRAGHELKPSPTVEMSWRFEPLADVHQDGALQPAVATSLASSLELPPVTETFHAKRRFNDFVWLHTQLAPLLSARGVTMPALPPKVLFSTRFEEAAISARRVALTVYLHDLASLISASPAHHQVAELPFYLAFITAEEGNFEQICSDMALVRTLREHFLADPSCTMYVRARCHVDVGGRLWV
jgi:hypothetical protein